jgi:hypothetical protein
MLTVIALLVVCYIGARSLDIAFSSPSRFQSPGWANVVSMVALGVSAMAVVVAACLVVMWSIGKTLI